MSSHLRNRQTVFQSDFIANAANTIKAPMDAMLAKVVFAIVQTTDKRQYKI